MSYEWRTYEAMPGKLLALNTHLEVAAGLIGIGGSLTTSLLPHHRAYGSVPRRFGSVKCLVETLTSEALVRRSMPCSARFAHPACDTLATDLWHSRRLW